jgi:hypothetical protein
MLAAIRTTYTHILVFAYGPATDMVIFHDHVWAGTLHATLGDYLNTVRDAPNEGCLAHAPEHTDTESSTIIQSRR